MAQDVQSQIDAITKVIVNSKSNPDAAKDQVKDFIKETRRMQLLLQVLAAHISTLRTLLMPRNMQRWLSTVTRTTLPVISLWVISRL